MTQTHKVSGKLNGSYETTLASVISSSENKRLIARVNIGEDNSWFVDFLVDIAGQEAAAYHALSTAIRAYDQGGLAR